MDQVNSVFKPAADCAGYIPTNFIPCVTEFKPNNIPRILILLTMGFTFSK